MMLTLGIDIGSTAIKCVILEGGSRIAGHSLLSLGAGAGDAAEAAAAALREAGAKRETLDAVVATGYGRALVPFAAASRSELSCHASGAAFLRPGVRTVIDIGGQDTKALQLSALGVLENFVMNDKCAAGTGRFLEVMSRVLNIPMDALDAADAASREPVSISATCTVFAESEVISRLAAGARREDVLRGVHDSIAQRAASLAARLQRESPILLTGGLARDAGLVRALERALDAPVETAPLSVYAGAIGAARIAARLARQREADA